MDKKNYNFRLDINSLQDATKENGWIVTIQDYRKNEVIKISEIKRLTEKLATLESELEKITGEEEERERNIGEISHKISLLKKKIEEKNDELAKLQDLIKLENEYLQKKEEFDILQTYLTEIQKIKEIQEELKARKAEINILKEEKEKQQECDDSIENQIKMKKEEYKFLMMIIKEKSELLKETDFEKVEKRYITLVNELQELENLQENEVSLKGTIIGVVGFYNKGKTFILNKLTGMKLPCGYQTSTNFIAAKAHVEGNNHMVFLDSAGRGQPVNIAAPIDRPDKVSVEEQQKFLKQTSEVHGNRAAIEDLLDNLLVSLSDFFIIVVNDLTWQDQLYISKIADRFSAKVRNTKSSIKPKLAVIHNWHHVSHQALPAHFNKYVEANYNGSYYNIDGLDDDRILQLNTMEMFRGTNVYIDHYFLVSEGPSPDEPIFKTARDYNKRVLKELKNNIIQSFQGRAEVCKKVTHMPSALVKQFNEICPKYFTGKIESQIQTVKPKFQFIPLENRKAQSNGYFKISDKLSDYNEVIIMEEKPKELEPKAIEFSMNYLPLSAIMNQYPNTTLELPSVTYESINSGELFCLIECPGMSLTEYSIDKAQSRDFWDITLYKAPCNLQSRDISRSANFHYVDPIYGESTVRVHFPPKFNPSVKKSYMYYEKGILILHIFDQNKYPNTEAMLPMEEITQIEEIRPISELRTENSKLKDQEKTIQDLNTKVDVLTEEKVKLDEQVKDLKEEKVKLEEQVKDLKEEKVKLEEQVKDLNLEAELKVKLDEQVKDLKEEKVKLEEQVKDLNLEVDELKKENLKGKQREIALENEINRLRGKIQSVPYLFRPSIDD